MREGEEGNEFRVGGSPASKVGLILSYARMRARLHPRARAHVLYIYPRIMRGARALYIHKDRTI